MKRVMFIVSAVLVLFTTACAAALIAPAAFAPAAFMLTPDSSGNSSDAVIADKTSNFKKEEMGLTPFHVSGSEPKSKPKSTAKHISGKASGKHISGGSRHVSGSDYY